MFTNNETPANLSNTTALSDNAQQLKVANQETVSTPTPEPLAFALKKVKSELRNNKKHLLTEKIKNIIIDTVYYSEERIKVNFSDYLSEKLNCNYAYMSNLFFKVNGITIQHFIINTKIERVKELLIYNDLTLTEIAFKLHYSSVAHVSNQFKKVTGVNPSTFLAMVQKNGGVKPNLEAIHANRDKNHSIANPEFLQIPSPVQEERLGQVGS